MASTSRAVWKPTYDSDDEIENQDDDGHNKSSRESLLVIIDSSPSMFQSWWANQENEDDTPFKAAIKSCHSMWKSRIISSPKDTVGVLLMGTETQNNSSEFPNLYVLQEMGSLTVNKIVELDKIRNSNDCDGFSEKIGSSSDYTLRDTFWLSEILFDESKSGMSSKKVILFTNEDNPHSGQMNLRNDAIRKFKDMGKVDFSVMSFKKDFDYDKFYKNILEDAALVSIPSDLESLVKVVRMKQRVKRPLTRTTLELSPGIKLGVGVYSLIRRAPLPRAVKINKRNNETVTKTVNTFRAATGAAILKSEQVSMVEFKGEKAVFKAEELKTVKYLFEPGVKVLGFLDQSVMSDPFSWFHSDGYFLYPDEDRFNGSQDLFLSLLRRCHILKKAALVQMVLTRGRTPRLGLLIPSMGEVIGQNQTLPQGFQLFKLPYSDEIRQFEYNWTQEDPSAEIIEQMKSVVKKVTNKKFDVLTIQNPTLQNKWREIEAAVLDDDGVNLISVDTFEDCTLPNGTGMRERIGQLSNDIMERTLEIAQVARASSSAAKKPKIAVNMAIEAKNRRVEKLTCDVLREFLEGVGVVTKKKTKALLVADVYAHFK